MPECRVTGVYAVAHGDSGDIHMGPPHLVEIDCERLTLTMTTEVEAPATIETYTLHLGVRHVVVRATPVSIGAGDTLTMALPIAFDDIDVIDDAPGGA